MQVPQFNGPIIKNSSTDDLNGLWKPELWTKFSLSANQIHTHKDEDNHVNENQPWRKRSMWLHSSCCFLTAPPLLFCKQLPTWCNSNNMCGERCERFQEGRRLVCACKKRRQTASIQPSGSGSSGMINGVCYRTGNRDFYWLCWKYVYYSKYYIYKIWNTVYFLHYLCLSAVHLLSLAADSEQMSV